MVPRGFDSRTGGRTFNHQVPFLWNQLLVLVWEADTPYTFQTRLKPFLFVKVFG